MNGQVAGRLCPNVHKEILPKRDPRNKKEKEHRTKSRRKAGTIWVVSSVRGTFSAVFSIDGNFWAMSSVGGTFWAVSIVGVTFWAVSRVGGTLLAVLRVGGTFWQNELLSVLLGRKR